MLREPDRRAGHRVWPGLSAVLVLLLLGCGTPDGSRAERGAPVTSSSAAPPAPAVTDTTLPGAVSVPGPPAVVVERDPATGSCQVTWTAPAYDGGSPLLGYLVTTESAPIPPTGAADIGTALQLARTTETNADVTGGGSITVSAENALGAGPGVHRTCA